MTKIYPVIHYLDDDTMLAEANLAAAFQADGVFLISHIGHNERLARLGMKIKDKHPEMKVGLNLLGERVESAAEAVNTYCLDMVWADYAGVSGLGLDTEGRDLSAWAQNHSDIDVFASVAFKYQRRENNPVGAAQNALAAGFIPTTSGAGTGSAPSVEKIKSMSKGTQGVLAVASGMTPENVAEFAPFLSHILVATGVSKDDYHFDALKMQAFFDVVRQT